MSVNVFIPGPWRNLTSGKAWIDVEASSIAEVMAGLEALYPGLKSHLVDEKGEVLRHVNIAVNGKLVSPGFPTAIKDGDKVAFVPALAGGSLRF